MVTPSEAKRAKVLRLFDLWRNDWNKFVSDVFGVVLDKEQQEILSSVQYNPRTSVMSGTARGKDFVAACAALCFMYLTPRWERNRLNGVVELAENTKVALTAPTGRQVKNIMLPEISRLFNKALLRGFVLPGKMYEQSIKTDYQEWFLTGFKADENNHEAWSGFHAVHTMFVITEATGISDDTFEAIEGNLQGDSRILIVFNPNITTGYAARTQKGDRWAKFQLSSLTAPNVKEKRIIIYGQVDYEWVKDKVLQWCTPIKETEITEEFDDFYFEGKWYRPEDLFRKKVLGKFPKVAEDVLIPLQWIEAAQERWKQYKGHFITPNANTTLGVDIAGMGRDNTVFCLRQGALVSSFEVYNSGGTADHMNIAGKIMQHRRQNPNLYISVDTIGEGAGVYARCIEQEPQKEYILSCKYSESAKDKYGKDLTDITEQYTFANMRAYLHWCVREWLNPRNQTGAMLPPDPKIAEEATEIRWAFRSDGKIIIEPKEDIKKRLGRSPDLFDALANTFYMVQKKRIDLEKIYKITTL